MQQQDVLEVLTPALSAAANTDPQVESVATRSATDGQASRYLHTSPEFAMKRLLCAYPHTDIYQIATVFRAEESGRFHVSQFAMLEYYRVGMDHHALMIDIEKLLRFIWSSFELSFPVVHTRSYCNEVLLRLGCLPDDASGDIIKRYFADQSRSFPAALEDDVSACLDLFMDEFVVSEFDTDGITFLHEYPASQAALAQTVKHEDGFDVAERFEVFVGRVELGNGFHELANEHTQRARFETDLQVRRERAQAELPLDENLLAALKYGLPDCSGIAMGIDRLLMVLGQHAHINEVLSFDDERA